MGNVQVVVSDGVPHIKFRRRRLPEHFERVNTRQELADVRYIRAVRERRLVSTFPAATSHPVAVVEYHVRGMKVRLQWGFM